MDPHRLYASVCAVMVCLLGATRLSSGDNCKCPEIPPKDLTVRKDGCFQMGSTYRYKCILGYTRKPGTSNLIKCQEKNGVLQWTKSLFKCITDPNYQPPPTTTTDRNVGNEREGERHAENVTRLGLEILKSASRTTSVASISYPEYRPRLTISTGPSSTLQSVRTSTSEPSVSPNRERSALGPSSSLQSVRTSTSEPSASPNRERSALGERTTVCISLIGAILFVVCSVIFFLYRQRNRPIPPRDPEELEAMKC